MRNDPWQLSNLAGSDRQEEKLAELRNVLAEWRTRTGDEADDPEAIRTRLPMEIGKLGAWIEARRPIVRGDFDVYLDVAGSWLVYARERCRREDFEMPFFLHVVPVDPDVLPDGHRQHGFHHLDFLTPGHGIGETCIAVRHLPGYPIAAVRTGQYVPGGPRLWEGEFQIGDKAR